MSRCNISDELWRHLQPLVCQPRQERRGWPAKDARLMLKGVLWVLRTGAPWRDLPEEFGPRGTVNKRYNAWAKSLWGQVLEELSRQADLGAILLYGCYIRAHQHSAGAKGGVSTSKPSAAVAAA